MKYAPLLGAVLLASAANAEVYNCKGVWTNKPCSATAKPVTDLPKVTYFKTDEAAEEAQKRAAKNGDREQQASATSDARGLLQRPESIGTTSLPQSGVIRERDGLPETLGEIAQKVNALSRLSSDKISAADVQQERLQLLARLQAICSPRADRAPTRFADRCKTLNARLSELKPRK